MLRQSLWLIEAAGGTGRFAFSSGKGSRCGKALSGGSRRAPQTAVLLEGAEQFQLHARARAVIGELALVRLYPLTLR